MQALPEAEVTTGSLASKEIVLRNGKVAIVDEDVHEELSKHSWSWLSAGGYAVRVERDANKRRKTIFMHKVIMPSPKGFVVDHINRNPLDNRRRNLRICTMPQNMANRAGERTSNSPYKGVMFHVGKYWKAYIKKRHIGHYPTAEMAALAYDREARKEFGEFAYLNFPDADPSTYPPVQGCVQHRWVGGKACLRCGEPVHADYRQRLRRSV